MTPFPRATGLTPATRTALFLGYVVVAALSQSGVLHALYLFSRTDASASHLLIIPFLSAALVFHGRREIFAAVDTEWRAGLAVILVGLALVGVAGARSAPGHPNLALSVLALVVLWVGGFVLLFGLNAVKKARFALAFLAFTIPTPPVLLDGTTAILKKGSADAVAALFTLTGTSYHRDGFLFSLPRFTIEVADQCSGIRSTIALVLTGLLAGHAFLKSTWSKTLLLAAIVPVTIFKNGVRIVSLSLLATYVDPGFLVGRLHHDGGIVFFLIGMALLVPVLNILRHKDGIASARPSSLL